MWITHLHVCIDDVYSVHQELEDSTRIILFHLSLALAAVLFSRSRTSDNATTELQTIFLVVRGVAAYCTSALSRAVFSRDGHALVGAI